MLTNNRPLFIAVDGIDGCGKSTLVASLSDYLSKSGIEVICTKEPGGTEIGNILRKYLISKEFHLEPVSELLLYSADRLEHQEKVVQPSLSRGISVITDRFISSTYAYQIFGRGLSLDFLKILHEHTVKIHPDFTFIIDIEPLTALERAKGRLMREGKLIDEGKFESLSDEFYHRTAEGFLWYSKNFQNVFVINGRQSIENVFSDVVHKLESNI